MSTIRHYRDLKAWSEAMALTLQIYETTTTFPRREQFGLVSQLQRAATSVPSNIAEGFARKTRNEFRHHLRIALGSLAELETQLILAKRLNYMDMEKAKAVWLQAQLVGRLIGGLLKKT